MCKWVCKCCFVSQEYFVLSRFVGDPREPVAILTGRGGSPGALSQWTKQSTTQTQHTNLVQSIKQKDRYLTQYLFSGTR